MSDKLKIIARVTAVSGSRNAIGVQFSLGRSACSDTAISLGEGFLAERGYEADPDGFTKVVICHRDNIEGIFLAEEELFGEDCEIIPETVGI